MNTKLLPYCERLSWVFGGLDTHEVSVTLTIDKYRQI